MVQGSTLYEHQTMSSWLSISLYSYSNKPKLLIFKSLIPRINFVGMLELYRQVGTPLAAATLLRAMPRSRRSRHRFGQAQLSPLYVPVSPAPGAARRKPCHVALITILDYCQPPALARRRPVHDKAVRARAPPLLLMKLLSALVDCTTAIRTLNGGCIPGHGTSYLMLRLRYEHPTWTIFPAKVVRGTTPLSLVILLCWYNADLCGTCV